MTEIPLPSPSVSAFKFTQYDIGNSPIVTIRDGSLSFALVTKRSFLRSKKTTTLTMYDTRGGGTSGGLLDWKNKTIEVMKVTKSWTEIQSKSSGALSSTREWVWSGKKYAICFEQGQWIVKFDQEVLATLTPLRTHTFGEDELATLTFHSEFPKEEIIFLIFAIVFATLQLPPRGKPLSPMDVSEAMMNIAIKAVDSCCTMQ